MTLVLENKYNGIPTPEALDGLVETIREFNPQHKDNQIIKLGNTPIGG